MIDAGGGSCYVMNMRKRCCRILNLLVAGAMLVTLAGCGIDSARDQRDERDPLLRRAQSRKNANDIEGAIDAYQRALDKKPQLALAHLQLGILFDQNREDYVRAIYHYERYLEMRPQSEKAELVRELVGQARVDFAASLPDKPSEAIRAIAMLKEENAALRDQLDRFSRAPTPAPAPVAAPPSVSAAPQATRAVAPPAVAPSAPAPATSASTYVVKSGDTLSRIAGKVYGDSKKWQKIYEANRSALSGGPSSVKVGQTLIIPAL